MKYYHPRSLFFKISFIFALIFALTIFFFLTLIRIELQKQLNLISSDSSQIAAAACRIPELSGGVEEIRHFIDTSRLIPVAQEEAQRVTQPANLRQQTSVATTPQFVRYFEIYEHEEAIYVRFVLSNGDLWMYENPQRPTITKWQLGMAAILTLLLLAYGSILRSVLPIKRLRDTVQQFATGELDIECATHRRDEIGEVANEFDHAIRRLRELTSSRKMFIRNIMHELRTPVTKGMLAIEMLEDSPTKDRLRRIFERQEELITDFARIEQFVSEDVPLDLQEYRLIDLVEHAKELLMNDQDPVHEELENFQLRVDYDLFVIAIKNLLDNGIKHSSDRQVTITANAVERTFCIQNRGKPLEHDLESYTQPYFLRGKKQTESRGLGFGLYIVLKIISLHPGVSIRYDYVKGYNRFCLSA